MSLGPLTLPQGTTLTPVPSFAMPSQLWNGPTSAALPTYNTGSQAGVPANSSTGGSGNPVQSALNYGKAIASGSPLDNPILWAVVLGVLAVFMFAHAARLELKT